MSGREFFAQVADALASFLPPKMRTYESRCSSHNLKVWFGPEPREHFEVQMVRVAKGRALEIGFHAEHSQSDRNDELVKRLAAEQRTLGDEAEAGTFLGLRSSPWRRLSEVWADAGDDAAVDAAERLAAYITTLEPLRKTT